MHYYFSNHAQSKTSSLNSLFSNNKYSNSLSTHKHYISQNPNSIICDSNIIQSRKSINNNNASNNKENISQKKYQIKNCYAETDSDTNNEENKPSYNGIINNNINNILNCLKDKIFSPGDYQEQDDLCLLNNTNNNNIDNNLSLISSHSQTNILLNRNSFHTNFFSSFEENSNSSLHKKTLILDLDETLVHSSFQPIYRIPDLQINIQFDKQNHTVYVFKRPFVDKFLYQMSKIFNIIIFTASVPEYANPLLDKLDIYKVIKRRYFRGDCTEKNGLYIKELIKISSNLKDMIILDNNPISYSLNKENGFPIRTWHFDKTDRELEKIIPYLSYLSKVDDVRQILNKVVNYGSIDEIYFDLLIKQKYKSDNNKETKNEDIQHSNLILNKGKSIVSIHHKKDKEHLIRVNRLKEEILNSISAIDPKGNKNSDENSLLEFNNSLTSSPSNNFTNQNTNLTVRNNNYNLKRTNSFLCTTSHPSSSNLNYYSDSNDMNSVINKPNYINFSRLSNGVSSQNKNSYNYRYNYSSNKEYNKSSSLSTIHKNYYNKNQQTPTNKLSVIKQNHLTPTVSIKHNYSISNRSGNNSKFINYSSKTVKSK